MKVTLKQGDLENIILNALWDLELQEDKIFVSDIQEYIKQSSKEWAYTTVKTVLDRLVDKDLARREKIGKKYLYHSVLSRDEAGTVALTKLLQQYFQNDVALLEACLERIREAIPAAKPFAVRRPVAKPTLAFAPSQNRQPEFVGV